MRKALLALALLCGLGLSAQLNVSFVGRLDYQALRGSNLANLWGYTDESGNEYALMGVCGTDEDNPGGLSVVSLADPSAPQEVFFFPGPASIWREIKVWGDYAYATTEAENGGLVIVDLSPLPQSTDLPATVWLAPDWHTSHSLFIDEQGRLYIHGANRGNGGVIMYDLTQDPMNPVEVGEFDTWYCHDSYARGDTLYAAHIYDGFFSIVDVSDPAAPVLLGTKSTPNDFTHNTWLDDSGNYLFTTDERTNSYVGAYDVSDPSDITEVDRLRSDNGSGAIPHNTYWLNDYVVTSYYTYGVSIYDASDPHNMVEVGHYDTSPFTGDGFNGAWGVYPFFASGNLIISDMEEGLFVLAPEYTQACRLEGMVRNAQTSAPVGGASITLIGTPISALTPIGGTYATGYHTAGIYSVTVSAPGYYPSTIDGVVLENGEVTVLDVDLEPMVAFSVEGLVITEGTGEPVPGAQVLLRNEEFTYEGTTDGAGSYSLSGIFADEFATLAGRWGWRTRCLPVQAVAEGAPPPPIELPRVYADDFALDLGWTVTGTATSGQWQRGIPQGTTLGNAQSNPGADAPGDCGDEAYVTGLTGGGAGDDDVDGGNTVLTSPAFDATGAGEAHVRYRRWFFNGGGSGNPNDALVISLSDGSTTVVLETVTAATAGASSWIQRDFRISDFMTPTSTMRLLASMADDAPGHVVEAGLDVFELVYEDANGLADAATPALVLYPNPTDGPVRLLADGAAGTVRIVDAVGRTLLTDRMPPSGMLDLILDASNGTYAVELCLTDGRCMRQRLILAR
jgi:choice-of-anchor B domain-containing protein